MRLCGTCILAWLLVGAAFAQTREEALKSKLTSVHYAPLAELARIQGDVRLIVSHGAITVVSGHPLLTPIATASVKGFGSAQSESTLDVTYHFVLVDTARSVPTVTAVKRGNAFTRAMYRVLGVKTEKVVRSYQCEEGVAPANDVKVNGTAVEVWVYGRTRCLQTNTSTLVARR